MKKKSVNLITAVGVLVVLSGAYVGVKTYVAKQDAEEAEADVVADEADAADEAVEVSSEALLVESRLESSTLAIIRPTITTTIRAGPAQLQIFL